MLNQAPYFVLHLEWLPRELSCNQLLIPEPHILTERMRAENGKEERVRRKRKVVSAVKWPRTIIHRSLADAKLDL